MNTRIGSDDDRKGQALRLATLAADQVTAAEATRDIAIRHANTCGASLREIADATALSQGAVKRTIDPTGRQP